MDLLDLLLHPQKARQRYSPLTEGLTDGQANTLRFVFNRIREGEHRSRIREERSYATYDPVIREVYAQDAGSLPGSIDALIKRRPGAVVMPSDRSGLIELLDFAENTSVPVTPRGSGTQSFGGAVPAEGGVVADMRAFDEILEIDEEAKTVTVQAGAQWTDVEAELNEHGLSLPVHPANSPASTIGGWVATGGGGFGSAANGTLRDILLKASVLTPALELSTCEGSDLDLVEGCHGATGFILDVTLKVTDHADVLARAAAFDTLDDAQAYLKRTAGLDLFSVHLVGPELATLKQEPDRSRHLPKKKITVLTAIEADGKAEQTTQRLETVCEAIGGEWLDEAAATWEWDNRFKHATFKRFGPSLAKGHAVVPRARLAEAWQAGQDAIKAPEWAIWAVAVSPDEFLLQVAILSDERLPNHPLAIGNAQAFEDAVTKHDGRPYAAGLIHAGDAHKILGKARVKRLKAWKKEHDVKEIMNPGKVVSARVKGLPMVRLSTALGPGMVTFKSLRGGFDHRRGSGPDTSNRALHAAIGRRLSPRLAALADEIYKCSGLGHTNRVGDLHKGISYEAEQPRHVIRAFRFDTQLPRGIVTAAKAILEGATPGPDLASHALSLPAVPAYQRASMNATPILPILEGVREAAQRAAGLDLRVQPIVDSLAETGNVLAEDAETRGDWLPGGAPGGVDTTSLLVAGDTGAYRRTDDAASAFRVLTNAGFGFTTLGNKEVHPGTIPYRLGAYDAACETAQAFAQAAADHLDGHLPTTLVCLSNEDADVMRRRLGELVAGSEHDGWTPEVVTTPQVLDELITSGRLTFQGEQEEEQADDEDEEAAEADEEGEAAAEEGQEDAAPEPDDDEAEQADGDGEPEDLEVTVLHSPFATGEDTAALDAVVDAIPGVTASKVDLEDLLVPDVGLLLTHEATAQALADRVKQAVDGTVLVACTDLAEVLSSARVDLVTLQEVVEQRMAVREGGAVVAQAPEEEEEGFKEHEIPEGAHRVELVKEEAAIPVFPDQSILDAAEEFGFELPFDCRAGSCVTCSAKWEGAAPDQSESQAIDDDEQKTHCLTCVSKPTGDVKIWSDEAP